MIDIPSFAGPFDVGNFLLGSQNILEMLFVMATSDDTEHQMIAAEAIIQAASKKDKAAAIIGNATDILQRLIKSPDDKVKVSQQSSTAQLLTNNNRWFRIADMVYTLYVMS